MDIRRDREKNVFSSAEFTISLKRGLSLYYQFPQFSVFCLYAGLISNSRPTFLHNRGVHAQLEMLHNTFRWRARDVVL